MFRIRVVLLATALPLIISCAAEAREDSLLANLIKERKECTTLIVDKTGKPLGTGLLTFYAGPKESVRIGVFTNWHVIEDADTVLVRVNTRSGTQDICASPLPKSLMPPGADLALLLLPDLSLDQIREWEGTDPLGRDKIEAAENINEGDKLFYIGFPLGLGVGEKNQPLVRIGYVSQKVKRGRTFLMDGFASHGNSGSPVFSAANGRLMGLIMAFKPDFVMAENTDEGLMIRLPYNSGIALVITSDEIAKIVMDLIPNLERLLEETRKDGR